MGELEEVLEEQGLNEEEIEEKVTAYRKMLISKEGQKKRFAEVDEFGRPVLKETHQIAEAMKEKNNKLKDAFGISKHFVEGSSFDINRKEMEEAAREDEKKKRQEEQEEPRRKKVEGKRRVRGKADRLRGAKETEGVGAERIEGEEVEVEGEAGAGAGVEDEAGREEGREGGTTAEKIRGGVGVGAEMSGGGEVKIGEGAEVAVRR